MIEATTDNPTPDLIEARRIVEELTQIRESMKLCDRKWLYTWRRYLHDKGDAARVGRFRLAVIRKIGKLYGLEVADEPMPEVERMSDVVIS